MAEINLLDTYPNPNRDLEWRFNNLTDEQRRVAKQFGKDYFDGDRLMGYGGYKYDGRWTSVVKRFAKYYGLNSDSRVLDVGCAKGFMLHDLINLIPGITVAGLDISNYAIEHAMPDIRPYIMQANARDLPFLDKSFDLVISINTVHNLGFSECKQAIAEIQRVSCKNSFITVDAWHDENERERLRKWVIIPDGTVLSVEAWKQMFSEVGYTGDYYWFIP